VTVTPTETAKAVPITLDEADAAVTVTPTETTTTAATETTVKTGLATTTLTLAPTTTATETVADNATGSDQELAYLAEGDGNGGFSVGNTVGNAMTGGAQQATETELAFTGVPVTTLLAFGLIAVAFGGLLLRVAAGRFRYRRQH
ncbi:MAG: hypothetical protein ABJD68_10195, partial [Nakamurella sp.]